MQVESKSNQSQIKVISKGRLGERQRRERRKSDQVVFQKATCEKFSFKFDHLHDDDVYDEDNYDDYDDKRLRHQTNDDKR
jgi:hypothetical protein